MFANPSRWQRLVCWLVGHRPGRGISRRRAVWFFCERCGRSQAGAFGMH